MKRADRIRKLLGAGHPYSDIMARTGCARSTVAYHARRMGKSAGQRPAYDWDAVQAHYDETQSAKSCRERFGFSKTTWARAVAAGRVTPADRRKPLAELLVAGTTAPRPYLKRRLVEAGLVINACAICGLADWLGGPIELVLDQANGDRNDWAIINLRLLCPNCMSVTAAERRLGGR